MDLKKIGNYIAGKRKAKSLTQKQLADQLGMSDKSVSKWERGVCLPDVSVYMELCEALGITINEFLAGEDIPEEEIPQKSERNILGFARRSKQHTRKLQRVIAVLLVIILVAASVSAFYLLSRPRNYLVALDEDSAEMQMVDTLHGDGGIQIFRYQTNRRCQSVNVYLTSYKDGKKIDKSTIFSKTANEDFEGNDSESGYIIYYEDDNGNFRFVVTSDTDGVRVSRDVSIRETLEDPDDYGKAWTHLETRKAITFGEEQYIGYIAYDKDSFAAIYVDDIAEEPETDGNEVAYYISVKFEEE